MRKEAEDDVRNRRCSSRSRNKQAIKRSCGQAEEAHRQAQAGRLAGKAKQLQGQASKVPPKRVAEHRTQHAESGGTPGGELFGSALFLFRVPSLLPSLFMSLCLPLFPYLFRLAFRLVSIGPTGTRWAIA